MEIKDSSEQVLRQLVGLIDQLKDEQFACPLPILSGNTIGKHIRHIIELYDQLLNGYESGIVNYDDRQRDQRIETESSYAINKLMQIMSECESKSDKPIQLIVDYSMDDHTNVKVNSSYKRELAYNMEHAIHHMAIIKMAVENEFEKIILDKSFGVAPSTLRYNATCAQ